MHGECTGERTETYDRWLGRAREGLPIKRLDGEGTEEAQRGSSFSIIVDDDKDPWRSRTGARLLRGVVEGRVTDHLSCFFLH